MTDLVAIASDRWSAWIDPFGAELHSLRDAHGADLLWDGDPAVWAGRSPILFPIVGALNGDAYRWDGSRYVLPRHGFARRSRFELVEATPAAATFRLAASDQTLQAYPFDFRLEMIFTVVGAGLSVSAVMSNQGHGPMPAAFGFHPALRWPLPGAGARAAQRLLFDADELEPVRRLDAAGLLHPLTHPTPVQGRSLVLDDALFAEDAVIFDRLQSRGLLYGADARRLRITWEGCLQLGVWTKPGAGYLCIEPWRGYADPQGFRGDLDEKPGMAILAPGETRRMTMTIAEA